MTFGLTIAVNKITLLKPWLSKVISWFNEGSESESRSERTRGYVRVTQLSECEEMSQRLAIRAIQWRGGHAAYWR